MTDSAERLRRIKFLFLELMDVAPEDRAVRLSALTGDDAELRPEIEELLQTANDTMPALQSPVAAFIVQQGEITSGMIGQRLGPYTVVRLVGQGGMGSVYEATRDDDQYQKRVAIKIVQHSMDSAATLMRFRRERQILASLEHPNIATLVDGGVTADGRPYLVMEYVDGQTITKWSDAQVLSIKSRVALFRQVCAAVQHAHRHLVIHGDLKPDNILVTPDGTVKLLDFGIAKLLGAADGSVIPVTRGGARAFTPEYASPEQVRGAELTTASDVYSLGVVLFELLTGRRPHEDAGNALLDIERATIELPVPRPSAVVTGEAARLRAERSEDHLRKHLRNELDNVLLASLHLEAGERYPSVEAFDADLRRYLEGLPVTAPGGWAGYRVRKFVQRNTAAVVASGLVVLAMIAGTIATAAESRHARLEQSRAEQVSGFLQGLLASVHPETGRKDAQVSEVLDLAAGRVNRELTGQPLVRAALESVIGQSYQGLGRYDEAEAHLKAALQLREDASGLTSTDAVIGLSQLGQLYMSRGALDSAQRLFQRALDLQAGRGQTSDSLYASLLSNMGSLSHNQGHAVEAEQFHRRALELQRKLFGANNDLVALTINDIGVAAGEQGRLPEAETLHREALATLRANNPVPDARIAAVLNALAGSLDFQGKVAAADSAYRETLALRKQLLGADHPDYAMTLYNYSGFIFDQKRYQEAAQYSREILALRGKTLPESHPSVASALQTLGRSLDQVGDSKGAENALRESLALRQRYLGAESWLAANSEGTLAEHFVVMKEYAKAEGMLLHAQVLFVKSLGLQNSRTVVNTKRFIALYTAWGKSAKVAEYQGMVPGGE